MRWIALVTAVTMLLLCAPALAHESSTDCHLSTNGGDPSHFFINGLATMHRNGDVIEVEVLVDTNTGAGTNMCDITDGSVWVAWPNPDGSQGDYTEIASGQTWTPGMSGLSYKHTFTVDLSDGVFNAWVWAQLRGTLHDGTDSSGVRGGTTGTRVYISRPHAVMTVTPDQTNGLAPLSVTYTYTVENDSPNDPFFAAAQQPRVTNVSISDDQCAPVNYVSGDTGTNADQIDVGETWTFTCTRLFATGGVFTNHASLTGYSYRDGRAWPDTTAQSTVTSQAPDLAITKSHSGDFTQGDTGRAYTITVSNSGQLPTSGTVTVTDTLPAGLAATAIGGTGWSCDLAALTCTRDDALAAGSAYPAIAVTVDVAKDAGASLVNTATVAGGADNGLAPNTASDPTTVNALPAPPTPPATDSSTPPVTTTVPAPVCKLSAPALQKDLRKRRRLNAVLSCDRGGNARVTANAVITGRARASKALVGTTKLAVVANRRTPVQITLSRKNARSLLSALGRARTVRVVFNAAVTGSGGQVGRATATIKKLKVRR